MFGSSKMPLHTADTYTLFQKNHANFLDYIPKKSTDILEYEKKPYLCSKFIQIWN